MADRYVVAGPPCAGKSTYAREHASEGDLVYDYDLLHQALALQPSHAHDDRIRPFVLAARDALYDLLADTPDQPAWIITATPSSAELSSLSGRLGAEVVLLNVSQGEAHRRCDEAGRPPAWHEYITRWYSETDIAAADWSAPDAEGKAIRVSTLSPRLAACLIDIFLLESLND